jgi:PPOX class probable F420-dependent enzyme
MYATASRETGSGPGGRSGCRWDRCGSPVGAVGPGDQFEVMARRVVEVDASATVVGVDLAGRAAGTGPECDAAGFDALDGAVEHVVRHEQRVVLPRELDPGLSVVQPDSVIEREAEKRPPARGLGESEEVLQKRRRVLLVLGGDSQVVEVNGHIALPFAHLHTAGLSPTARDAPTSKPEPTMPYPRRHVDESTEFGSRVARHLRQEHVVWLTTVTSAGAPLPRPVGFSWDGGEIVSVYSQPGARVRNIASNPNVTLNFAGDGHGGDVVILDGTAEIVDDAPSAAENEAWVAKYARRLQPDGHGRRPKCWARVER